MCELEERKARAEAETAELQTENARLQVEFCRAAFAESRKGTVVS